MRFTYLPDRLQNVDCRHDRELFCFIKKSTSTVYVSLFIAHPLCSVFLKNADLLRITKYETLTVNTKINLLKTVTSIVLL